MSDLDELLRWTAHEAAEFRRSLPERPVQPAVDAAAVRAALGELADGPEAPQAVVEQLVDAMNPVITATAGPRFFGFVIGGALDAATAADMLAVAWDQPAYNQLSSPA